MYTYTLFYIYLHIFFVFIIKVDLNTFKEIKTFKPLFITSKKKERKKETIKIMDLWSLFYHVFNVCTLFHPVECLVFIVITYAIIWMYLWWHWGSTLPLTLTKIIFFLLLLLVWCFLRGCGLCWIISKCTVCIVVIIFYGILCINEESLKNPLSSWVFVIAAVGKLSQPHSKQYFCTFSYSPEMWKC